MGVVEKKLNLHLSKDGDFALADVLSGLSDSLGTEGSQIQFLVNAHAWVVGCVPTWGLVGGPIGISLPPFLPPFPSF